MTTTRPVTVVTGGSRGIGAAVVLALAARGHDLVVGYVGDAEAAARTAGQARNLGAAAIAVQADVTDPGDVVRLFEQATALGVVTGLVACAGLTAHIGDLADTPVETVRTVLDVNLWGTVLCCRQAASVMSTERGGTGGAIVTISSAAATLGSPHEYVHYAAAKAGVEALTVGLAKELAQQGVRVNCVSPGLIHTDIHAAAGQPDRPTRLADRIPLGRAGQPSEVAPAVAWLLGPEAGYATGAVLRVAGGM